MLRLSACLSRAALGMSLTLLMVSLGGATRTAHAMAAIATPPGTTLAASPCPMAHCAPQLNNQQPGIIPTGAVSLTWTLTGTGMVNAGVSLGCTTGPLFAICVGGNATNSAGYGNPYAYAIDPATGGVLWTSGALLNQKVKLGVALIDSASNVYLSDNNYLASFSAAGTLRWRVPNPARSTLVSFNITADGYLVGQGAGIQGTAVVVADPRTGSVAGTLVLSDTVAGVPGTFGTVNTVTLIGNRLYTVTQFYPTSGAASPWVGRLYAIDIVGGIPRIAWHWDFVGPTGTSPMSLAAPGGNIIYFDGAGLQPGDPQHTLLLAIRDTGTGGQLLWSVDFTASFGIPYHVLDNAPGLDPRGGLWEKGFGDPRLFRFTLMTGAVLQTINMNALMGTFGNVPHGSLSIAANGGNPVMFQGLTGAGTPTSLIALNLTTGRLLWRTTAASGSSYGSEFPVALTPAGPVVVAMRYDGLIAGFLLK